MNNMYFISIEYTNCVYDAYIMCKDNMERAFNQAISDGACRISVWHAHFTPEGILTYGGVREMSYV